VSEYLRFSFGIFAISFNGFHDLDSDFVLDCHCVVHTGQHTSERTFANLLANYITKVVT
jgi:hypothetical protein